MNKVGDSGSPYLIHLEDLKNSYDFPLNNTEYQLLEINLHTMSMIYSEKPNLLNTLIK